MINSAASFKDFGLILLCIVASLAVFVAFLMIENLYLLLAIILAVAAVIYLFTKVDGIRTPIVEAFQRRRRFVFVTVLAVIVLLPFIFRNSPYWIYILTIAILWIIVCLGINIQFGSAGIINLGAAAFYGVGAYTAGMLATRLGSPALLNLFLGAIMAMVVGSVLFIPVLKTSSYYLALVTIAFVMA